MRITQNMSLAEKLNILSDAAKYDVACTSSGIDRILSCLGEHFANRFSVGKLDDIRQDTPDGYGA